MMCRKCNKELKIKYLTVQMNKSNSILQNQNESNRLKFKNDSCYENMKIEFDDEKEDEKEQIDFVKPVYRNCYHFIAWESYHRWKKYDKLEEERKSKWSRYDCTTNSYSRSLKKSLYIDTKKYPFLLSDREVIDDDYIKIIKVPIE